MKKASPTEYIERSGDPSVEHSFIKMPGKTIKENTLYSDGNGAIGFGINKGNRTEIHTHPANSEVVKKLDLNWLQRLGCFFFPGLIMTKKYTGIYLEHDSVLASGDDFYGFLCRDSAQTMIIASRESDTGKVRGYTVIKKTGSTPYISNFKIYNSKSTVRYTELKEDIESYDGVFSAKQLYTAFENFTKKYNLHYRFVPTRGFALSRTKSQFIRLEIMRKQEDDAKKHQEDLKKYEEDRERLKEIRKSVKEIIEIESAKNLTSAHMLTITNICESIIINTNKIHSERAKGAKKYILDVIPRYLDRLRTNGNRYDILAEIQGIEGFGL